MEDIGIVNKVAQSGIVTIDLEDVIPAREEAYIDIKEQLFHGLMLKEKDFLWALSFAGGAAQAALDSKNVGLQKIPSKGIVQNNASYFYNLIKFRDL